MGRPCSRTWHTHWTGQVSARDARSWAAPCHAPNFERLGARGLSSSTYSAERGRLGGRDGKRRSRCSAAWTSSPADGAHAFHRTKPFSRVPAASRVSGSRKCCGTARRAVRQRRCGNGGAADGHWGNGLPAEVDVEPLTLLELKNLGLSRLGQRPRHRGPHSGDREGSGPGLNPTETVKQSGACVNGMALNYASYFGVEEMSLASIVEFLLGQRLPDGGFNCRLNRSGARHSSVHTTSASWEGLMEYQRRGYQYQVQELCSAQADATNFLLRHQLFRSERTGRVMNPEFTRLHHPARWHFDVLRGLHALADSGAAYDPRMDDALQVVRSRRGADGRWAANRAYPGLTHVAPPQPGQPNRWISLIALRVLNAYPITAQGPGRPRRLC